MSGRESLTSNPSERLVFDPPADIEFPELFDLWADRLRQMSQNPMAWIFGSSPREVYSELMLTFLWAYIHWKPREGPFGAYFLGVWRLRRRNEIRKKMRRQQLASEVLVPYDETLDVDSALNSIQAEAFEAEAIHQIFYPDPPVTGIDKYEVLVWRMLQYGYLPTEIVATLPLSNRRYYRLITNWQRAMRRDGGGEDDNDGT